MKLIKNRVVMADGRTLTFHRVSEIVASIPAANMTVLLGSWESSDAATGNGRPEATFSIELPNTTEQHGQILESITEMPDWVGSEVVDL